MGGMGGLRITTLSTVLLFVTSTLAADGDARIHQNGGTTSTGVVASEGAREMSARHDGAAVIKPGQTYVGKQGFTYGAGASAGTVGAQKRWRTEGLHERLAHATRRGCQSTLS